MKSDFHTLSLFAVGSVGAASETYVRKYGAL